jgi:hypothetical protein
MVGASGEVDAAAADFDEEQDVELGQPDGVDDEEVGGEEVVGVLADELAPGALAATRSGREAMAAEQASDREVRAAPPELEELALDAVRGGLEIGDRAVEELSKHVRRRGRRRGIQGHPARLSTTATGGTASEPEPARSSLRHGR